MSKLPIPDAALDDRLFFGGTAGSGKTYNAGGRVERLLARKNRVVIPDPLGVWWGLRLMADGKTPSDFDVVIFGGPHGDLPLTEAAGALIGETVAGMKESCILDLSQLGTKASERRFMLAFLTALYKHTPGEPVHMIFDEADMWAPQKLLDKDGDAARLLGMMETIVRRGRSKGFIPWLISQRPAVVTKDILSQADGIVVFKLTSSQDRKAIEAWVEGQADKKLWESINSSLPTMERGQGLVWIPGRNLLEIVRFPEKETFDSSRTPKRGEKLKRTAALKPIDLGAVKDRLAVVETEAKANDPRKLRAESSAKDQKIKTLEAAVAAGAKSAPNKEQLAAAESRGAERGEKAARAAAEKIIKTLRANVEAAMKFIVEINARDFFRAGGEAVDQAAVEKAIAGATTQITKMIESKLAARDRHLEELRAAATKLLARLKEAIDQDVAVKVEVRHNEPFTVSPAPPDRAPRPASIINGPGDAALSKGARVCLTAMAQHPNGVTREQLTVLTGYKRSSRDTFVQQLRAAGNAEPAAGDRLVATEAGVAAIGSYDPLPTGDALREHWLRELGGGERVVLELVCRSYPEEVQRETISENTIYKRSSRDTFIQKLMARELLEQSGPGAVRASADLFD